MTPRQRYAVIGVFLLTVTLGAVFNLRQSADAERTRITVCGLVFESARTEADKLAEYDQNPPTTLAGQAQRDAVAKALARWNSRAARLGCND